MAVPQTVDIIPLEIPVLGLNRRDPLSMMDPRYAAWIDGWEPEPQFVRIRNGIIIHANMSTKCDDILGLGAYGTTALYVYTQKDTENNKIWNVTSSGVPSAAAETCADDTADEAYLVKFGNRSAFTVEADYSDCGRVYDGSSWTAWGFTYDPGTGAAPIGGRVVVSFKGRVYIFSGTGLYYSALAAVTGATTYVDFSTRLNESGSIVWAGVLTSPSNKGDELFLAFGNSKGEVLVYAGDNPGATNWEQVAYFKISPPLWYNSALQYNNDIWIATSTGIISVRKLFESSVGGQIGNPDVVSVSSAINPYWIQLTSASTSWGHTRCSMAYWPEQNKVYVLMLGYIGSDGTYISNEVTLFSYNAFTGAWMPSGVLSGYATSLGSLTYFNNGLYFWLKRGTDTFVLKMSTAFKDEILTAPGTYSTLVPVLQSAYTNLGNNDHNKQVVGFECLINTDLSSIGMHAAADFGRKVSDQSRQTLLLGNSNAAFHVGVKGTYLQYRIQGMMTDTSTEGLELYSMGVMIKP